PGRRRRCGTREAARAGAVVRRGGGGARATTARAEAGAAKERGRGGPRESLHGLRGSVVRRAPPRVEGRGPGGRTRGGRRGGPRGHAGGGEAAWSPLRGGPAPFAHGLLDGLGPVGDHIGVHDRPVGVDRDGKPRVRTPHLGDRRDRPARTYPRLDTSGGHPATAVDL